MTRTVSSLKKEDATRLRDCLEALATACGHDVFRLESVVTRSGVKVILTCSRKQSEAEVGKILAAEFRRMTGPVEVKDDQAEDVSG